MNVEDLIENFELLGEWEERYAYIIDLGRKLPPLPEADHTESNKVRGCMSQVWLTCAADAGPPPRLKLMGDSNSHLVKGLIALLFLIVSDKTPAEIAKLDIVPIFARLGLENHITMNRRNGFFAMVERIRQFATQLS